MMCSSHPRRYSTLSMLGLAAMFTMSPTSFAQDMPHIDAVGAYNHANVMTRPHVEGDDTPDSREGRQALAGTTISRREFDAIVSDLRAEYQRRVERDGQAEADTWLRQSVAQLKKRYTTIED